VGHSNFSRFDEEQLKSQNRGGNDVGWWQSDKMASEIAMFRELWK
jgi:hypothetical protein